MREAGLCEICEDVAVPDDDGAPEVSRCARCNRLCCLVCCSGVLIRRRRRKSNGEFSDWTEWRHAKGWIRAGEGRHGWIWVCAKPECEEKFEVLQRRLSDEDSWVQVRLSDE